ncbi:MAG: LysR family transcriptional regulator [Blastomonas sp.]
MIERLPNIRHITAFVATVRHGSVTRAAQAVNLTQPALTQAIARLEDDLGCQLFERGPEGMRPTVPALLLASHAETAIGRIGSPRVTSTQIFAFLALARAGSYSAAAERTGLSSASLHRAVNDLSLALGQRLVERHGRHLVFTGAGRRRARSFGLSLAELRSGFSEVAQWLGKAAGRIVIGAMPLSRARWLPQAILAFRREHPGIEIAIVEGSHSELAGPLRDGEIDLLLGALRDDAEHEDLLQEPVFEDRPQIIMRVGHPLASGARPGIDALIRHSWILPSDETPLRQYWEAMVRSAGAEPPHVDIECGSVLTIRELLLDTDALTLLSPDQLRVEIEAGLLLARTPPVPVRRTIGITTRRDWRPTPTQQHLLAILRRPGA